MSLVDHSIEASVGQTNRDELQGGSSIKGISIVASHGKRMICILRSFLLDYRKLRLTPIKECVNKFYTTIQSIINDKDKGEYKFLPKMKKWKIWKSASSYCLPEDFNKTFRIDQLRGHFKSNMKCFPQFINGSAINIEIKKEGDNVYTLTVSLIPPTEELPEDEDLQNKLVFMAEGSEESFYKHYNYKVPFHKLEFRAKTNCFLIREVLESVGDQYNVIIVRHGQGYHNIATLKNAPKMLWETDFTADTRLTPKGIDDAKIGANSIKEYFKIDLKRKCKYFSSDLYRAKETAVLIAKHFKETEVTVTQLPIIHEISNCEKADSFTMSSIPDMQFPSDAKNPDNRIYCKGQSVRNIGDCDDQGIKVTIDYYRFYYDITLYKYLFYTQYFGQDQSGHRTYRREKGLEDTSFFLKPYERNELLLAFTLMEMKEDVTFYVNGSTAETSGITSDKLPFTPGRDALKNILKYDHLNTLPGFRDDESKARKLLQYEQERNDKKSRVAKMTRKEREKYRDNLFKGGNRNTLKKRRKRRTNKMRFTNKRMTNKRKNNKRKTNKKRTYIKRRTVRQRK